jgi:hypothetical protein
VTALVLVVVAAALAASGAPAEEKKKAEPPHGWEVKPLAQEPWPVSIALRGVQADRSFLDWTAGDEAAATCASKFE